MKRGKQGLFRKVAILVFVAAATDETEPTTVKTISVEAKCECTMNYLCDPENVHPEPKFGYICQPRGSTVCCKSPKQLYSTTAPLPTSDTGEPIFDSRCYCVPTYLCLQTASVIMDPIVPCNKPFVCCPKALTAMH